MRMLYLIENFYGTEVAGMSTGGPVFLNAEVSCSPKEMKFSQAHY